MMSEKILLSFSNKLIVQTDKSWMENDQPILIPHKTPINKSKFWNVKSSVILIEEEKSLMEFLGTPKESFTNNNPFSVNTSIIAPPDTSKFKNYLTRNNSIIKDSDEDKENHLNLKP